MTGPIARDAPTGTAGGARDREAYFVAAYNLLAAGGCEAVTVAALCERLHVTKGSFYHHFADMPAFVAAFADRWQAWVSERLAGYRAEPDPMARLELIGNGLEMLTGAEAAIRAWARTHPVLANGLTDMQQAANAVLVGTLSEITGDPELAGVMQMLSASIAVGCQLRLDPLDPDRFLRLEQQIVHRGLGLQFDIVHVEGRPRLRSRRGLDVDPPLHPQLHLSVLEIRGIDWAQGEPWPRVVSPGGRIRGRDAYFTAARDLLAESGSGGLTVAALCTRLSVTKGSFHWHFEGMPQFVAALAEDWESVHIDRLIGRANQPDPWSRLEGLHREMLCAPDPAETAWRAWAHTEPVIGTAVRRVDRHRHAFLTTAIQQATGDLDADVMAEGMLALAIGLRESQQPAVGPDLAAQMVLEWARRFLGLGAHLDVDSDGRANITLGAAT